MSKSIKTEAERRRLLVESQGAALLQYAVVLAVIVGVGLGVMFVVGSNANDVLTATARLIDRALDRESADTPSQMPGEATSFTATSLEDRPGPSFRHHNIVGGLVWGAIWVIITASVFGLCRLFGMWEAMARSRRRHGEAFTEADPPELLHQLFVKRQQIRRVLSNAQDGPCDVQVQQIMSTDVVTVTPEAAFDDVVSIMGRRRIRHLLVRHRRGDLLGVISDRDVRERTGATAGDVMTGDLITVSLDTGVAPAITLMLTKHISCLPVMDRHGKMHGVLTTTDCLLSLQCTLRIIGNMASGWGPMSLRPDCRMSEVSG